MGGGKEGVRAWGWCGVCPAMYGWAVRWELCEECCVGVEGQGFGSTRV